MILIFIISFCQNLLKIILFIKNLTFLVENGYADDRGVLYEISDYFM